MTPAEPIRVAGGRQAGPRIAREHGQESRDVHHQRGRFAGASGDRSREDQTVGGRSHESREPNLARAVFGDVVHKARYRQPDYSPVPPYTRTPSGRQDLNLRPLDPQSSALPSCATSRCSPTLVSEFTAYARHRVDTTLPRMPSSLQPRTPGSSMVSVLASASSVAMTPNGTLAKWVPCPSGRP